jgi:cell division septation protein DedD
VAIEPVAPPAPAPSRAGSSGTTAPRQPAAPARPSATDNKGDPRIKGERYFVLAHPSSDRASEMVEFCRANGLDAYLVPDDNALLRKVIVLPGYKDASQKSSPEIKALEAKIRSVGEKWKKQARGNKDFGDAYPELFR